MSVNILVGDCREKLRTMPDESVQCVVTSPPYFGLRDYGHEGQIGLETAPDEYVGALVDAFVHIARVLREDGTVWLNLGDSYAGSWGAQGKRETPGEISRNSVRNHPKRARKTGSIKEMGLKPKDLIGIPWRVAFALQAEGWYLREDIIWSKPNPMPESVQDRCTRAHEYLFMLTKSPRYYYDQEAIKEDIAETSASRLSQDVDSQLGSERANGGRKTNGNMRAVGGSDGKRNCRSVWTIPTRPFREAHFATFPPALAERCIRAGSKQGDMVLDPFGGAGTTALVADQLGRDCTLIELNPEYAGIARQRIERDGGMLTEISIEGEPSHA